MNASPLPVGATAKPTHSATDEHPRNASANHPPIRLASPMPTEDRETAGDRDRETTADREATEATEITEDSETVEASEADQGKEAADARKTVQGEEAAEAGEAVPAGPAKLLRRMYEIFNTQQVDDFTRAAFHPDVDWPNVAEGTRLHGIDAVLAYWKRQFAVAHPLVRMEGMTAEPDGRIAVRVRPGLRDATGDHWSDTLLHHVYAFRDGKVAHMEVRRDTEA
ncbi:nuclear transport factor 2 family protein [Streptomyces endophytica]|uniref:Nuclear transport factor 2 family protein n=1 Tax=Streptomyces endophytica TaxID=2991496 RepID=A0ABY6P746_9ACTN|nr:nuclear transport factor 2 family protein [Streptomyces endophytica]UZJ29611.1 nuclear transport factor 2 family protein [Streptomyces endophytica]